MNNISYNFDNISPKKWVGKGVLLLEDHKENGLNRHKPRNRNKVASHLLTPMIFRIF